MALDYPRSLEDADLESYHLDAEAIPRKRVSPGPGWVSEKVGRQIVKASVDSVTDSFTYKQGSTTLFVLNVIYASSAKEEFVSVERVS